MKIHSLKLTLQDAKTADNKDIAAIFGTVFIDTGATKENPETKEVTPIYETINFTTALFNVEGFKSIAQQLIIEALTLKNMEIAKENGTLSHFVRKITGETAPKSKNAKKRAVKKLEKTEKKRKSV